MIGVSMKEVWESDKPLNIRGITKVQCDISEYHPDLSIGYNSIYVSQVNSLFSNVFSCRGKFKWNNEIHDSVEIYHGGIFNGTIDKRIHSEGDCVRGLLNSIEAYIGNKNTLLVWDVYPEVETGLYKNEKGEDVTQYIGYAVLYAE